MLSDKKYGLTITLLSTRVLPVLVPQLVNPQLDLENYVLVHSTVQDMLDHVDRHQRNKLKNEGEGVKSPDHYRIKYDRQLESMAIPNLVIRRPSVVQVRKSLSEVSGGLQLYYSSHLVVFQGPALNNSLKSYRFTAITSANNSSGDSSPENSNYLRVSALFGNRRWSENTISQNSISRPPISSASSPGSCPGSPIGLPNRSSDFFF